MKFKKFKHDLKKDNLVIPLMSDELKNYSNAIAQERQIEKQEQLKTKSHFSWSRYLNRVIPIMTVFIIALIVILSGNLFRKPFEEKNGYELYTVQNEEDFQRIINYNNIDEDINSSQEPQGPGGEQGEQGKPGESGDAAKPDYSNTNLQEENVDESDVVKTDPPRWKRPAAPTSFSSPRTASSSLPRAAASCLPSPAVPCSTWPNTTSAWKWKNAKSCSPKFLNSPKPVSAVLPPSSPPSARS